MPTERKRAIRTAAAWGADQAAMEALYGVGGYYTSLSLWEAGEQANLTALDEIRTAVCYNDWPSGLSDHVIIDGWTTDATRYAQVTVAEGHRHDGTPNTGFWIYKAVDFDGPMSVRQAYTRVSWVDVRNTSTAGFYVTANNAVIERCIGRAGWFPNSAFSLIGNAGKYIQCLAYLSGRGFVANDWNSQTLLGCVSANHVSHGYMSGGGGAITAKNCVAYGNGEMGFQGSAWSAASTNNATSSASDDAPGGASVIGLAASDFVDAANNDFHISSGSVLRGAGVNLYSDFQTDIDGDTWPSSGAWDIGFDYYVAAGGSTQDLAGTGSSTATGAAAPAAQVALAGVGVSLATGTASATGSAPLTATGTATASGTAAPRIDIALSALGLSVATGTATLDAAAAGSLAASGSASASGSAAAAANVTISAAGLAQAAAAAGLSAQVLLAGAGAAAAAGNAALAAQLRAAATGGAQASGTATITGSAAGQLSAGGSAQALGSAALVVSVRLAAAGSTAATGAGAVDAGTSQALAGSGQAGATGAAQVVAEVVLTGAGFVQAMGVGYLVVQVDLAGAGAAVADGAAAAVDAGALVLISVVRWRVDAAGRRFTVDAAGRRYEVSA